jgi:hypothetical protein
MEARLAATVATGVRLPAGMQMEATGGRLSDPVMEEMVGMDLVLDPEEEPETPKLRVTVATVVMEEKQAVARMVAEVDRKGAIVVMGATVAQMLGMAEEEATLEALATAEKEEMQAALALKPEMVDKVVVPPVMAVMEATLLALVARLATEETRQRQMELGVAVEMLKVLEVRLAMEATPRMGQEAMVGRVDKAPLACPAEPVSNLSQQALE